MATKNKQHKTCYMDCYHCSTATYLGIKHAKAAENQLRIIQNLSETNMYV